MKMYVKRSSLENYFSNITNRPKKYKKIYEKFKIL